MLELNTTTSSSSLTFMIKLFFLLLLLLVYTKYKVKYFLYPAGLFSKFNELVRQQLPSRQAKQEFQERLVAAAAPPLLHMRFSALLFSFLVNNTYYSSSLLIEVHVGYFWLEPCPSIKYPKPNAGCLRAEKYEQLS